MTGRRIQIIGIIAALWAAPTLGLAVDDLTVLHLSDLHVPHAFAQTQEVVAALPVGTPIELTPYGVTAAPPGAILVTGDLNEFGGGEGAWERYLSLWADLGIPVYHQLGNHDNTWECARPRLRALGQAPFTAFEMAGVKFIGWDTATPQDPRPSIATEGLRRLQMEFARTPVTQPVIFYCHHPPDGREFAGEYDRARLLDLLATRNVVLMLVGHGHGVRAWPVGGIDTAMGGSSWGDRRGYGIVSIRDGILRVAYRRLTGADELTPLLEKPLVEEAPRLEALTVAPPDGTILTPEAADAWSLRVRSEDGVVEGHWTLDGEATGPLTREGELWVARPVLEAPLEPGAHVIRLEVTDTTGRSAGRTVRFFLEGGPLGIAWSRQLDGTVQGAPVLAGDRLYVGANDGTLTALEAASGRTLWHVTTDGEVRGAPAVDPATGRVFMASADGSARAFDPEGVELWRADLGSPTYATPLLVGERLFCPTGAGAIVALAAADGTVLWRCTEPGYAIETAPVASDDALYAGSWDRYVYCLGRADGTLRWRVPSAGSDREAAARYYSPADCSPAPAGDRLFVTDRAYRLTVLDAATGVRLADEDNCAAVAASADGQAVYVRHTDGRVSRRNADGSVVWTAQAPTGVLPTPPVIVGGRVYVVSNTGILSILDEATGALWAQQRVFTGTFVFAAPATDGRRVYLADATGQVLALEPRGAAGP